MPKHPGKKTPRKKRDVTQTLGANPNTATLTQQAEEAEFGPATPAAPAGPPKPLLATPGQPPASQSFIDKQAANVRALLKKLKLPTRE